MLCWRYLVRRLHWAIEPTSALYSTHLESVRAQVLTLSSETILFPVMGRPRRFMKRYRTIHLSLRRNMDHERQTPVPTTVRWIPCQDAAALDLTMEAGERRGATAVTTVGLGLADGLFLATVFTTLWAGAYATNADPFWGHGAFSSTIQPRF